EGDFDAALDAADALLAEAAAQPRAEDDATRQALVHAMLGEAAFWGHRLDRAEQELGRAVVLARAHSLDHLAVSALSTLGLLDVMKAGPADDRGRAQAAIDLAAKRGWSNIPQTACAHTALALVAFYDLHPHDAAAHLELASVTATQFCRR